MQHTVRLGIPCVAALTLALAACGGSVPSVEQGGSPPGGSPPGGSPSVAGPSGQGTDSTSGPSVVTRVAVGIVELVCNQSVTFLDPASGRETSRIDLATLLGTISAAAGPHYETGAPCIGSEDIPPSGARLHAREAFDRDYARVAVVDRERFPDGSTHVGFIDVATGNFTDVTAMTRSSGFSAHAPIDTNPLFDPTGNVFWFLRDTGEIFALDLDSGQSAVRAHTTPADGGFATESFVVAAGSDQPVGGYIDSGRLGGTGTPDDEILPNPSGTLAATDMLRLNGTPAEIGLFTNLADTLAGASNQGALDTKAQIVKVDGPPVAFAYPRHCVPLAWVNDGTLVCARDTGGLPELALIKLAAGQAAANTTSLLPTSERLNYDPVVSPDGSTIAFLSLQGSTILRNDVSLYTAVVDHPGADPTLVGKQAGAIIDWR